MVCLLCGRQCAKCFTYGSLFSSHSLGRLCHLPVCSQIYLLTFTCSVKGGCCSLKEAVSCNSISKTSLKMASGYVWPMGIMVGDQKAVERCFCYQLHFQYQQALLSLRQHPFPLTRSKRGKNRIYMLYLCAFACKTKNLPNVDFPPLVI